MHDPIRIVLTEQELLMAAVVGASRHYESFAKGRTNAHGLKLEDSSVGGHIEGAAGEAAVARFMGRYWAGDRGTFKAADIGSRLQVRTRSKHTYDLIVRDDDRDDHAYVLVTGRAPVLLLRGWLWGVEAKRDQFRNNPGGREEAWFVPASFLRPMRKSNRPKLSGESSMARVEYGCGKSKGHRSQSGSYSYAERPREAEVGVCRHPPSS